MDRNKRISRALSTNRLTDLPDCLVGQILARLPVKEAARTSMLSKKWKDKWLTIPHLVFNEDCSGSMIYHVLQFHKEPIVKFEIKNSKIMSSITLHDCFNFLSRHRIEDLTIQPPLYSGVLLDMPYPFFSFYNLKHLSVLHMKLSVPSVYNGFSNLISIDLEDVFIELKELQRFISKCPMLESLSIVNLGNLTNSIVNPNLKSFQFEDRVDVDYIYIHPNAHLEDVSISFGNYWSNRKVWDYAIKFFGQLSMITKLKVNCNFLKVLGTSGLWKLPQNLHHLKCIQVEELYFGNVGILKFVLCLIRSSPSLQTFVIRLSCAGRIEFYSFQLEIPLCRQTLWNRALEYMKEEQKSAVPLSSSLKEVKIHCFAGWDHEMEFVKLLFSGALELRKVELTRIYNEKEFPIIKRLESFRRSSSQEIILSDYIYRGSYYKRSQRR